ncbi:MAG: M23 family metallopeptidase [Rickettsiales bacterium]|jgi:murein DD-endopeptidase MepM/ murein hydrolase activator NlpD|nr:M23 family metallopeptidase [Rickettsiales bacterium]
MGRKIKNFLSFRREIIVIFNHSIYSKKIGLSFLLCNLAFVLWSAYSTIMFFQMQKKYVEQERKIVSLESNEQSLLLKVSMLDSEVSKISEYVSVLGKYDRFLDTVAYNDYVIEDGVDEKYLPLIGIRNTISAVNNTLLSRIEKFKNIEKKLLLGKNDIKLVAYNKIYDSDMEKFVSTDIIESLVFKKKVDDNVNSVIAIESFLNKLPLSRTIDFIKISSPFGVRIDPVYGGHRTHFGIDLVGPYLSKIYAPADGKVVFAGTKERYGNVVILEHENGIRTLYGHLSSFSVKDGEIVKRGHVIGVQGATGKVTGDHLHYEVIGINGEKYNPKDLIDIGEKLF